MGLCSELYDRLPSSSFLADVGRLHSWNPNSFERMAVEFVEGINIAEGRFSAAFHSEF